MFYHGSSLWGRKTALRGGLRTRIDGRLAGPCFECLEERQMLSVSWIGGTSGYWDVAANWSNDAVPSSTTDVSIATSGATVTVRPGDNASAGSLTIAAGSTLSIPFGPAAGSPSQLVAGSLSNSGTLIVGPTSTVTIGGAFAQTSTGTLDVQLGGAPSTGSFGLVDISGAATLAGTLQSDVVDGYSPATTDTFTPIEFASESGSFASETLPSGSGYQFNAAVTFTNVVIAAAPTTALNATVNASISLHAVTTNLLGVNLTWWDQDAVTTQTQQMVTAAGLDMYRFPGGSDSDDYHFNVANNYDDSGAINIVQFVQFITSVGGTGLVTLDYGSGSPQEAAAELAYLDGSPTDPTSIGNGIQWNDNTGQWQTVNWRTVGYWAALRGASPLAHDDGLNFMRIAHPAAFTDIKYWEVGNEEYGSWEIDHHGTATPRGVSTGAAHDPATYAAFAKQFASLAREIQTAARLPQISIGIDSGDPTGASDGNWTKNVLADGLAGGFVPGFISDHSYMQGPGQESDSFLLDDTVSDSGSLLDWSTRYADYQTVLQQTLASQASSVQVMATEYNSVYSDPGKQTTSLVNGLFVADSLGSLLESGYSGGFVWDLRNSWHTGDNNSNLLYGWREGGDYGQLGDPSADSAPATGAYIAYPDYYALQLASKIVQGGGQVVSAASNYSDLHAYAVLEPSGDLDLLVINVNPAASLTEQFDLTGFQPGGPAQVWQYGETQDTAQSQSATGASALAHTSTSVSLSGSNFGYTFPAYSMTVLDLSPALSLNGPATVTAGHRRNLAFRGATAISVSDSAATASTIDTIALSVRNGTLAVSLGGGATITAGSSGSASLTLSGTLTQLNAALGTLVYTAPATGASDTLSARGTDGIASGAPLSTTILLTNIGPIVAVPASATPNPIRGTTTRLSVLGADSGGAANLTYTWTATALPSGASVPTFSANGTNAARITTASFTRAGSYTFKVTIDQGNLSVTSSVTVTVEPVLSVITVSPAPVSVVDGATQQFIATAEDQFGVALAKQPAFTWKTTVGKISSKGLLTAPARPATGTVTAASGRIKGTSKVTVVNQIPGNLISRSVLFPGTSAAVTALFHANSTGGGAVQAGRITGLDSLSAAAISAQRSGSAESAVQRARKTLFAGVADWSAGYQP